MSHLQNLAAQARGVFLAAAVGDALGWPQEQNSGIVGGNKARYVDPVAEFRSWTRNGGPQYQRYLDPVPAGSYSDDTQLILATARALQSEDWFDQLVRRELPLFLLYQRGAGGATLRACRTWATARSPWDGGNSKKANKGVEQYFRAGGNGVAMRIAPHVVASANADPDELVANVVLDGAATHGHPRALVGAAAYAFALHILLTTEGTLEFGDLTGMVESDKAWQTPEIAFRRLPKNWLKAAAAHSPSLLQLWDDTTAEMRRLLSQAGDAAHAGTLGNDMATLEALGCFDRKVNGSGTITAAAAIYLASRNAPRPMSGLLRAAFVKNADTDTLASMTGALMGALHGSDWLGPIVGRLQDRDYIERLADACTGRALGETRSGENDVARAVHERAVKQFKDKLRVRSAPNLLPDGRPCRLIEDMELETSGRLRAHRWLLDAEGQTFIVDQTARSRDSELAGPIGPKQSEGSMTSGDAKLDRLSLRTKDLAAVERFYRFGLGVSVDRIGIHQLLVGGLVRFIEDLDAPIARPQVLLSFQVRDFRGAATRLDVELDAKASRFRLKDPAGNEVDVRAIGQPA